MNGTLERLVKEDYGASVSPEAKAATIAYITATPSVDGTDLSFIRHATRTAHRILCSDPTSLDGITDKVYWFNIEGIQRIDEALSVGRLNSGQRENMMAWRCYMYANAGAAARAEFNKTQRIIWEEMAYTAHYMSAELSQSLNLHHSAHMYRLAGDDASRVSRAARTPDWRHKAINCYGRYLAYCQTHPGEEQQELISAVEQQVRFLNALDSYASSRTQVPRAAPPHWREQRSRMRRQRRQ